MEVEEMFRDFVIVSGRAEITRFAIHNLKWNTTGAAGNDWFTFVKCFGDLDFEALTG